MKLQIVLLGDMKLKTWVSEFPIDKNGNYVTRVSGKEYLCRKFGSDYVLRGGSLRNALRGDEPLFPEHQEPKQDKEPYIDISPGLDSI